MVGNSAANATYMLTGKHLLMCWQDYIGRWNDDTFGKRPASNEGIKGLAHHIRREAAELIDAVYEGGNVTTELADLLVLSFAAAHVLGIDLETELANKMRANLARQWQKPDSVGVIEHVREGSETEVVD